VIREINQADASRRLNLVGSFGGQKPMAYLHRGYLPHGSLIKKQSRLASKQQAEQRSQPVLIMNGNAANALYLTRNSKINSY
jgi:hypothetical protein